MDDGKRLRAGPGVACWLAAVLSASACASSAGGGAGGGGGTVVDAGTPVAPGWVALKRIPVGVGEAAIAALDGKIYLLGGFDTRTNFQIYDVASDTWTAGPELPLGTDNAGAVGTGGKVYLFGGEATPAVQIYDVASAQWSAGPDLPSPRFSSVVELVGDRVHLVGGWSFDRSNNVSLASHTVFDLGTQAYLTGPFAPLAVARNHAFSAVLDGKIYAVAGRAPGHEGNDASNVATTEVYDPGTDGWTPVADLPTPRSGGASAVLGGRLYVLGGGLPGSSVSRAVERYDPVATRWESLSDMPIESTGHRAIAVGADLYVFGGFATKNGLRQGNSGVTYAWRYTPP